MIHPRRFYQYKDGQLMSDATLIANANSAESKPSFLRQYEFMAFSIVGFLAKSMLLIRLPYREWYINIVWTTLLLVLFYGYFRFRFKARPPLIVVFCMAFAIGIDVAGNLFHLYGKEFFGIQYDEYTHFLGSGASLVPVMWALRATTRRWGLRLPNDMVAFFATCITFSLCAWYEILELWDELFYGDFTRLWTPRDSANDLQWNLAGIIVVAFLTFVVYKLIDRREQNAFAP